MGALDGWCAATANLRLVCRYVRTFRALFCRALSGHPTSSSFTRFGTFDAHRVGLRCLRRTPFPASSSLDPDLRRNWRRRTYGLSSKWHRWRVESSSVEPQAKAAQARGQVRHLQPGGRNLSREGGAGWLVTAPIGLSSSCRPRHRQAAARLFDSDPQLSSEVRSGETSAKNTGYAVRFFFFRILRTTTEAEERHRI